MRFFIKYIIPAVALAGFFTVYYLTGSWKISLVILGLLFIGIVWVLKFETGLLNKGEDAKTIYRQKKKMHEKKVKDNPALR